MIAALRRGADFRMSDVEGFCIPQKLKTFKKALA